MPGLRAFIGVASTYTDAACADIWPGAIAHPTAEGSITAEWFAQGSAFYGRVVCLHTFVSNLRRSEQISSASKRRFGQLGKCCYLKLEGLAIYKEQPMAALKQENSTVLAPNFALAGQMHDMRNAHAEDMQHLAAQVELQLEQRPCKRCGLH